jgi:hypothetical protein
MFIDIELGKGFVTIIIKDKGVSVASSFPSVDAVNMELRDLMKELSHRINENLKLLEKSS